MRIDRLDLTAFGCFTDRRIELGSPGVHVVSGPNEAGKSTARHALDQLLYGMDRQTSYDFVHAMRDLRIGAVLRDEHGATLDVVRHKRDKNALTRADGTPLAEAELTRLLAGVGRDDFRHVFALDHAGLRAGGHELLQGRGDVGRALFESRSSARLGEVLIRLETRAAELYKARGKNQRISAALTDLAGLRKRIQDDGLAPAEFGAAVKDVQRAEEERDRLGRDRTQARIALARLERVKSALPVLRERARLGAERAALAAAGPLVTVELAAELAAIDTRLHDARTDATWAERELDDAVRESAESAIDHVLLAHAADADAVHADVEAIRDTVDLAADAEDEASQARARAAELLARVRPDRALDDPTAYDVPAGIGERITDLRDALKACETRLADAADTLAYRTARRDAARAALAAIPEPGDPTDLRALLKAVPGTLVDDIARAEAHERELADQAADLRTRHDLDDLSALAGDGAARVRLPGRDRIADHVEQLTSARADLRAAVEAERELSAEHDARSRELAELSRVDPPPSPAEWAASRAERDRLWTLICAAPPLTDDRIHAYERAVADADELAERIATRAEVAVRRGRLEIDVAHDGRRLSELAARRAEATARRLDLDAAWARAWPAGEVPTPDPYDALDLVEAVDRLARIETDLRTTRARLDALRRRASEFTAELRSALAASGAPTTAHTLPALVELADHRRDLLREALRERDAKVVAVREAEAELAEARAETTRVEADRAAWESRRHELVRDLDLAEGNPDTIAAAVTTLAEVAAAVGHAADADRRRARAADRVAQFHTRVAALCAACARPRPADAGAAFDAVAELAGELTTARGADAARARLAERITRLESAAATGRAAAERAGLDLDELVTSAGAGDAHGLRAAVERSDRIRAVDRLLAEPWSVLSPEIEQEAARYAPEELDVEVEDAGRRAEEAEAAYAAAGEALGRCRQVVQDKEKVSFAAARAREEAAGTVAVIAEDTEEFVRLHLAREVLLRCMEDYRKQNQAPVLGRAEEIFTALTVGRFDRLVVDTDERKGAPVLRARRAGGPADASVGVDEMSEGTRDQLYLALRLASLDAYADAGRAMPIVLDDIAMTFDDGRTRAMLAVLDGMADRFQVVLFTHHPHLGRLAEDTLAPGRAHVHELPVHRAP